MDNIKIIATDLDNTLLLDNKTISNYTIDILTRCMHRGIKIIFATARSEKACERFLSKFKPNAIISNGGALAKKGDSIIYRSMLSKELSNKLINLCIKTSSVGYITVETDNGFFVNDLIDKNDLNWLDYLHGIQFDFTSNTFDKDIYKLNAEISNHDDAYKIANLIPEVNILSFSGENWYCYSHKSANKWTAIQAVAASFEIDIKDIISFGDDYNDIEMLKNCGLGITVENAINEAKAVSNYTCASNNENGVAQWLENNILNL